MLRLDQLDALFSSEGLTVGMSDEILVIKRGTFS